MPPSSIIKKLSVVVSCFNEEGNVQQYLETLIKPLERLNLPLEIVLVDDGSLDKTKEEIEKLQAQDARIKLVLHEKNKGLGEGLRTGFSHCTGDVILTMDADLTFSPNEVSRLVTAYKDGIDIVMGSPFLGSLVGVSLWRKFLTRVVNGCYSFLLGENITAVSSIFRLYRIGAIRKLPLIGRSFEINAEILFKALQEKMTVVEVPATLSVRKWGESKLNARKEAIHHLLMFFRIFRWRLSFLCY